MAGQWKLMWWRFRRHRPAVVSAVFLALIYFSTVDQRVHRALRPAHAALGLHLRAAAAGPCHARGPVPRAVRLCAQDHARHGDPAARLHARHDQAAEAALLLPGRFLRVLGPDRGQLPFRLPARGRHSSSGWAPTGWAATCSAASSMPRASRSPSASSALRSPSRSPWSWAGWPATTAAGSTTSSSASPRSSRASRTCRLWLALSAALPVTWSPLLVYFGITIILALLDWPGLGRAVRSKLLSLARGGLRRRRPDDGRQARPHHRPPSAAGLHEPSHRLGHAFHSLDDPGRDGA